MAWRRRRRGTAAAPRPAAFDSVLGRTTPAHAVRPPCPTWQWSASPPRRCISRRCARPLDAHTSRRVAGEGSGACTTRSVVSRTTPSHVRGAPRRSPFEGSRAHRRLRPRHAVALPRQVVEHASRRSAWRPAYRRISRSGEGRGRRRAVTEAEAAAQIAPQNALAAASLLPPATELGLGGSRCSSSGARAARAGARD